MTGLLKRLWPQDEGQNLPEYALLLCLVILIAVAAMSGMASRINNICYSTSTHMAIAAGHGSLSAGSSEQGGTTANSTDENRLKSF